MNNRPQDFMFTYFKQERCLCNYRLFKRFRGVNKVETHTIRCSGIHSRSCLKYVNAMCWNIFKVKLQGSKVNRIRPYHECTIRYHIVLTSHGTFWIMMSQTLAGLERSMTCVIAVGGRIGLYPGNSFDVGG